MKEEDNVIINPSTLDELVEGGPEAAKRPDSVRMHCPICGFPIHVSVHWEQERGEFGSILAEWPELSSNPREVEKVDYCFCDFSKPLIEVMAGYWNDGERLDNLLDTLAVDPPESGEAEKDDFALLFEWTQRTRDPWLFLKRLLNVYDAATHVKRLPSERNTYLLYLFNQLDEIDDETNRALRDLVDMLFSSK